MICIESFTIIVGVVILATIVYTTIIYFVSEYFISAKINNVHPASGSGTGPFFHSKDFQNV